MSAHDPVPPAPAGASADRLLADAARAADVARVRMTGALNDLFRSPDSRLNDRDHATASRMLAHLVTDIERALRERLVGDGLLDGFDATRLELADLEQPIAWPRLAHSRVMREPVLIGLLMRRCQEHYVGQALRRVYPLRHGIKQSMLDRLAAHADSRIEEAASNFLITDSRRIDRFGDPLLDRADLPLELQHRVTWWVAAALRDHMTSADEVDREAADRALVAAAASLLENYDNAGAIDSRAADLVSIVKDVEGIDDSLIAALLTEGQLPIWISALSLRAEIDAESVWPMIADADGSRLTLLLRAINMDRALALGSLVELFVARGGVISEQDARLTEAAAAFDALSVEDALAAIKPWRPTDHYRRAVAGLALDEGHDQ
jgi:hypothetical protein